MLASRYLGMHERAPPKNEDFYIPTVVSDVAQLMGRVHIPAHTNASELVRRRFYQILTEGYTNLICSCALWQVLAANSYAESSEHVGTRSEQRLSETICGRGVH